MKIIITTSGIGSRLGKLTKYTNKSLVRVGNQYVIDYIISKYINIFFNDIVFREHNNGKA